MRSLIYPSVGMRWKASVKCFRNTLAYDRMIVGEGFPAKVSTKLEDRGEVLQLPLMSVMGGSDDPTFWWMSVSIWWKRAEVLPLNGL
jgi:hypothetical protein